MSGDADVEGRASALEAEATVCLRSAQARRPDGRYRYNAAMRAGWRTKAGRLNGQAYALRSGASVVSR